MGLLNGFIWGFIFHYELAIITLQPQVKLTAKKGESLKMTETTEETTKPTFKKAKTIRKTSPTSTKKTKYSSEEVDKLIENATKRAEEKLKERIEESQMRRNFDITDEESEAPTDFNAGIFGPNNYDFGEDQENASGIAESEEMMNAFDLFEYVEKNFIKAGTPVKYQVKKDGTLMGEISHPCSWTKIQKKWGEGHYTVAAKKRTDNTYIKQQTLDLGPAETAEQDEKDRIEDRLAALAIQNQQPQGPQIDMTAMMTNMMGMFQKMQEMNHTDKKTEERDNRKSENQYNQTMLQLMQGQQQSSQTMFMEMTKSTQSIIEKMNENMIRSQEKMEDKFTRMFEKLSEQSNKKEQFGTFDIINMMKKAEDDGWSKMQTLMELSEAKASEKEDSNSNDGMIGKLIGGILPLLSGAQQQQAMMLNQHQRGQLPGPTQNSQPRPQANQHGFRVNQTQTKQTTPGQASKKSFNSPVGVPGLVFDELVKTSNPVKPRGGAGESLKSRDAEVVGDDEKINARPAAPAKPQSSPKTEEVKTSESLDDILSQSSDVQRGIAEIAVPRIAEGLMATQDPRNVADECLNMLWSQKQLGSSQVLENFPFDFMLRIARAFGIGQESNQWFKEFYAHIEDQARMESQGSSEPTEDSEPQLGIW